MRLRDQEQPALAACHDADRVLLAHRCRASRGGVHFITEAVGTSETIDKRALSHHTGS